MVAPDLVSEEDIAKLIIPDDLPDGQPTLTAYIEAKVYDGEGHVIQYRRQPMRSPTRWLLALMAIPILQTFQGPSTYKAVSFLVNTVSQTANEKPNTVALSLNVNTSYRHL